MDLRQQIVADRIESIGKMLNLPPDIAFMRLAHALITERSVHAFDPTDIVDGGQDKQLDVITIDEHGETADIYVLQTKNCASFSSNALIQLGNGLRWIFQRPRKELDTLTNTALRDKILEYRAVLNDFGPSNLRIHVRFVTNGSTKDLSDEYEQELVNITTEYGNDTFESFTLESVGADELLFLSKAQERQTRQVNADIKIKYDTNNPSLIKYYAQDLKGLVCSVPGSEIAKLVNDSPDGSVFDLNIRRFLGTRGAVNKDIQLTCTNVDSSYEFWFLNNGITVVCDHFDPVTDPDNPHVKLRNLQIVNGCQTATTIAMAQKEGKLQPDVRVLTRIYETTDPTLVDKIVLTTNNQNRISSRDLRANDPLQVDMQHAFRIYGYHYERKPREFDAAPIDFSKLFTNEYVAQAYLATVLKSPSDARARKYKVWEELHSRIFSGNVVEPYIVSAVLARRISDWLSNSAYVKSVSEVERLIAKRGAFHVTRIAAALWRTSDDWSKKGGDLEALVHQLDGDASAISEHFDPAFRTLVDLVCSHEEYCKDVDRALKSASLDREIDRTLHKSGFTVTTGAATKGA